MPSGRSDAFSIKFRRDGPSGGDPLGDEHLVRFPDQALGAALFGVGGPGERGEGTKGRSAAERDDLARSDRPREMRVSVPAGCDVPPGVPALGELVFGHDLFSFRIADSRSRRRAAVRASRRTSSSATARRTTKTSPAIKASSNCTPVLN